MARLTYLVGIQADAALPVRLVSQIVFADRDEGNGSEGFLAGGGRTALGLLG